MLFRLHSRENFRRWEGKGSIFMPSFKIWAVRCFHQAHSPLYFPSSYVFLKHSTLSMLWTFLKGFELSALKFYFSFNTHIYKRNSPKYVKTTSLLERGTHLVPHLTGTQQSTFSISNLLLGHVENILWTVGSSPNKQPCDYGSNP